LAKKSPLPLVLVSLLPETYQINWFVDCITDFFRKFYQQEIEIAENDCLEVYPKATQIINDTFASELVDRIHASPARPGGSVKSRFDTVLVRRGTASQTDQLTNPSYGIARKCHLFCLVAILIHMNLCLAHYVGCVRLICRLPEYYGVHKALVLIQIF
jgi:hypothetical protein